MIAATITIIPLVLCLSASWCHTRKLIPSALSPSMPYGGRDTASPKSLAGDTYAIVRVATVTTNNDGSVSSYKTVSDFSGLTADWERLTSSEYHDAAKKLAHAAKTSYTSIPAPPMQLANLLSRTYRLAYIWSPARIRRKPTRHYDCDPFLISIPGSGDTAADLNITVEPKFSTSTPPTPPEHEHNPGEMPGNPGVIGNTGAAVGGIAGVAAVIICHRICRVETTRAISLR